MLELEGVKLTCSAISDVPLGHLMPKKIETYLKGYLNPLVKWKNHRKGADFKKQFISNFLCSGIPIKAYNFESWSF